MASLDEFMDWAERARKAQEAIDALGAGPPLSPSADLPACRDEDPAWSASLAACYPDPPEYQHPEDEEGARLAERDSYIGTWSNIDITKREPGDVEPWQTNAFWNWDGSDE